MTVRLDSIEVKVMSQSSRSQVGNSSQKENISGTVTSDGVQGAAINSFDLNMNIADVEFLSK